MNKRFLSFIAAAALLLSAGACSGKNDAGQDLKDAGNSVKDAGKDVLDSAEDAAKDGMDALDDALDGDDSRNENNPGGSTDKK